MYRMSKSEYMQYQIAENKWQTLRRSHAIELQSAYDNIHPTRTGFDYGAGRMYSESVNVEDYVIYLIELKEEHERAEHWWKSRALLYKQAISMLTEEEKDLLNTWNYGTRHLRERIHAKLQEYLSTILFESKQALQRISGSLEEAQTAEEADEIIDAMSPSELLEDYVDLLEVEEEETKTKTPPPDLTLEEKKQLAINPVTTWTMTEEERLAYIEKNPIRPTKRPKVFSFRKVENG